MTHPIEGQDYITLALCVNSQKRRFKHDYAIFEKAQNLRSTFEKICGVEITIWLLDAEALSPKVI